MMTYEFESEKEKINNNIARMDMLQSTNVSSSNKWSFFRYKVGYGLTQMALGAPFSAFNTYINFQLQVVGYTIGAEPGNAPGTGCSLLASSCNVPFGQTSQIDYVSFVNYINAICYASSGLIILAIAGLADRIGYKREQYVLFLIVYGAFALPSASLNKSDRNTFSTLAALYIVFNMVGFVAGNWGKYFIPFLMFHGEDPEGARRQQEATDETIKQAPNNTNHSNVRQGRESKGMIASVWGNNALSIGQMMVLLITIGVTYASASFAGLYVSTASGVLCILLSLIAWRFLPEANTVKPSRFSWYMEPICSVRDLLFGLRQYPQAFKLLMAYTIYADSILVFGTVIASLFTLNVSRDQRIYSAYSIIQPASALFAGIIAAFMFPRLSGKQKSLFSLKKIMCICVATNTFVMVWCCIGISTSSKIGFRHGWEFYLWQAIQGFVNAFINFAFQVLFCQLIPRGKELEYFGFQTVLSCATIWIPQIVNGPIVTATNIVRLPAVVSLITLLISLGLLIWCDEAEGIKTIEEERPR